MTVLVLGGSYFIGRTLVERLLADGHEVSILNRGSRPVAGAEQLVADRNRADELQAALGGRAFDWVVDTSCYTAAHAALALAALDDRFQSWLYLSTAAVYPGGTSERVTENEVGPGREWEDYGWNKLLAERELERCMPVDPRLIILRAPYVYGPLNTLPREWWLWARMLQGRPIWVPRDGSTPLHFVHVSDLVDAMCATLQRSTEPMAVFNVAQQETPTMREYLGLLGEIAGVSPRIEGIDYESLGLEARSFFPFRDFQCLLSTERLARIHGWQAHYDMRSGLTQTLSHLTRERLLSSDVSVAVEDRLLRSIGS